MQHQTDSFLSIPIKLRTEHPPTQSEKNLLLFYNDILL